MELFLTSRKRCEFPFIQLSEPVDLPISVVNIALGLAEEDKKRPLVLVGNEPALHPELEQILTQCAKHSIQPVLETNGLFSESAKQINGNLQFHFAPFLVGRGCAAVTFSNVRLS